jgi:hypothetical protein
MHSLVIPVYGNEASIGELLEAIAGLSRRLSQPLEAVFVVDGSPDRSYALLRDALPRMPFPAQLLVHSRNFGAFAAIRTGLAAARGEDVAVMAADLQDPIELIERFYDVLARDEADVIIGTRVARADPFLSRVASGVFWWLYRRLVLPQIPPGGVDVFACNRAFRTELLALGEANTSLVGQLFWVGMRRAVLPYERLPRRHGRSAWSFSRKLKYLMDSVFAFSDLAHPGSGERDAHVEHGLRATRHRQPDGRLATRPRDVQARIPITAQGRHRLCETRSVRRGAHRGRAERHFDRISRCTRNHLARPRHRRASATVRRWRPATPRIRAQRPVRDRGMKGAAVSAAHVRTGGTRGPAR